MKQRQCDKRKYNKKVSNIGENIKFHHNKKQGPKTFKSWQEDIQHRFLKS